jgi:hypothetical protein
MLIHLTCWQMHSTPISKLPMMKWDFEFQQLVLINQLRSLKFCALKRSKRCCYNPCVNLHLQMAWISNLGIFPWKCFIIKGCFELCNVDFYVHLFCSLYLLMLFYSFVKMFPRIGKKTLSCGVLQIDVSSLLTI